MARLIGYVANRADRLHDALIEERLAVGDGPAADADGWGIGFYQGGEVLHKKRPVRGAAVSWAELTDNVRTDCAIVHVRHATVGDYRAENTHPFRMRQWLFAHTGTVAGFAAVREPLVAAMPDFLRRNIRGTTDSEHVFHAVLSFLHDGGQLDNPDIDPKNIVAAARSTISLIDRLTAEVGAPDATLDFVLSNGRVMLAARRGDPMGYVVREVSGEGPGARGSTSAFRYAMVVANGSLPTGEGPLDWHSLAPGQAVVIDRTLAVSTHSL